MRFLTFLGISFYVAVIGIIGFVCILFGLHVFNLQEIVTLLHSVYTDPSSRIILCLVGLLFILISLSFAQLILGKMQKERTIAFTGPSGRVTIALSAVEDLIRRMNASVPEARELRPYVIAGKKGIEIDLKVVLRQETSIPDLTTRLQDLIKIKLQEVLGVDEQIIVRIHVAKIVSPEEKKNKKEPNPSAPYSGF